MEAILNKIILVGNTFLARSDANGHPVAAYIVVLSQGSRRSQVTALRATVAAIARRDLSEVDPAEVLASEWYKLALAHKAALHSAFQERYSPAMDSQPNLGL